MPLSASDRNARHRAALLSLLVGVVMVALKLGAYLLTGSAAILSDAIESVVHVAATAFMFWCFRLTITPPDAEHPYGHGRAEGLSIGFEGGTIALAAFGILWEAGRSLLVGQEPRDLGIGLWLIGGAAVINQALGLYLVRVGRRTNSELLIADGTHVLSDVWTSVGVFAGVTVMLVIPDPRWRHGIDVAIAVTVATVILVAAVKLVRNAFAVLLDEADPALLQRIVDAIESVREPGWSDIHNLRCRTAGDHLFIDLHLTIPGDLSVREGHAVTERLESSVLRLLGREGSVLVHLDVADHPAPSAGPFTVTQATRMTETIGHASHA